MGGLFGIAGKENCSRSLFYGTDYHSHLGTENGGLAVLGPKGFFNSIHSIGQAQFKSRFVDDYKKMDGHLGLGVIDDDSSQPLIIRSKFGTFAIAATGLITNKDKLTDILLANGDSFNELETGGINQVELVGKLICLGNDLVNGIARMQNLIEGSICALIMTEKGIYAARDRFGRFPLSLGGKGDGEDRSFVVATEASSFNNLGCETVKYLGPGEVALITADKYETVKSAGEEEKSVRFSGFIPATPHRVMRASAWRGPGKGVVGRWPEMMMCRPIW